jgi:hypothetical protein
MGYSISHALHTKLEKNRTDGRLCAGATRARAGCPRPATVKVWTTDDDAGKTYGPSKFCRRHAQDEYAQVGFTYANGPTVVRVEQF